jgi:hypothetical protein
LTVRIAILVEGSTELAFKKPLLEFLQAKLENERMPKLDFLPEDGRIPKEAKLKRKVEFLLRSNDAVIALTDVYTGGSPPDFRDAREARTKMRDWVGSEPRFYPHAAQHDFEAWLLPYWSRIQKLARSQRHAPSPNPESVNHQKPPSYVLTEIFRTGGVARRYLKTRDAAAILRDQNLQESAARCPELKDFLNTILKLSGGQLL